MEKVVYKESVGDQYVHVVSVDGVKAWFDDDDLKVGTLVVAGAFEEVFEPAVWNFITDESVEDGVYYSDHFELLELYPNEG